MFDEMKNTVLMQTGLKFYGKTSWLANGFGLPAAGLKANDIIPKHLYARLF